MEGGRFVEIGKRGIGSEGEVHAKRSDVCYFTVALDSLSVDNPIMFQSLMNRVCEDMSEDLWSVLPITTFDFKTQFLEANLDDWVRRHSSGAFGNGWFEM